MNNKLQYNQYFTRNNNWLTPPIIQFINNINYNIIYDPFAGEGHIFDAIKTKLDNQFQFIGLDIDNGLKWEINDSLINIPKIDNSILITNPPYLAKNSAKRKDNNYKYFNNNKFQDLYQIALNNCLNISDYVIAIIPESYLNQNLFTKRLKIIQIIEENLFNDTDCPVCVVCFDNQIKPISEIQIYKNNNYLFTLDELNKHKLISTNKFKIKFNDINGQIGIRCIDSSNSNNKIEFFNINNFDYDLNKIKESSRNFTTVNINIDNNIDNIVNNSNLFLNEWRLKTHDLLLTPFKGNNNKGIRRRRLDFNSVKCILEKFI